MIEANQAVFGKLRAAVAAEDRHRVEDLPKRYIKTSSSDKEWLQHFRILETVRVFGSNVVSLAELRDKQYVVVPHEAQHSPHTLGEIARRVDGNAGIATALWASEDYRPVRSRGFSERVIELIGSVEKYEWTDVAKLFPPFTVYAIDRPVALGDFHKFSVRLYGDYLLRSSFDFALPFSTETQTVLQCLLAGNAGAVGPWAILQALLASNWTHAYLDLFRLIEHLYAVPFLGDLVRGLGLGSAIAPRSVRRVVEQSLPWKPKELSALERLFSRAAEGKVSYDKLAVVLGVDAEAGKVAGRMYEIRNGIAHFRAPLLHRSDDEWNVIIRSLANVVQVLYDDCFFDYCGEDVLEA